jgi:cAMP phosphodiesterase
VVAVDAGVHLSVITRILEDTQPKDLGTESTPIPHTLTSGPFKGLELQSTSPAANAAYITRSLVDTYLITHPHLDHISGFVINTAALPGTRPKRLAGLPSTISAFKTHIFNNVIWPNLSDENNGAGLVTYMRLVEGGSPALGDGDGKGYMEISDGLAVKMYSVSHGHCIEKHSHRGSTSSTGGGTRLGSFDASNLLSPRVNLHGSVAHIHAQTNIHAGGAMTPMSRAPSMHSHATLSTAGDARESVCVYDSSAYFIRDTATGREVLIFGDVEPDSISLSPRNQLVWQEAAPKIAMGSLAAIFIECSFDDSQSNDRLFGHLKPVYIIEELRTLAGEVELARHALKDTKKRKRQRKESIVDGFEGISPASTAGRRKAAMTSAPSVSDIDGPHDEPVSPRSLKPNPRGSGLSEENGSMTDSPHISTPTAELTLKELESLGDLNSNPQSQLHQSLLQAQMFSSLHHPSQPLKGLKVVIIHIKERLNDGPPEGDIILNELLDYERDAQLGCEFIISTSRQSLYV